MAAEQMSAVAAQVCGVKFWNQRWLSVLIAEKFGAAPVFHDSFDLALAASRERAAPLILWASSLSEEQRAQARQLDCYFLEDGFIRSVGLGAGLNAGLSYVFDRRGIYYNAARASDLEHLLQHMELTPAQLQRGERLRQLLVANEISKYNLKKSTTFTLGPDSRRRILVVGQVQNDASITTNPAPQLATMAGDNINLSLIRWCRQENPEACIVYKPHPDVAADLRPGKIDTGSLAGLVDGVVVERDILALIDWCDELHTISSLAGFEALIRGKAVVTHGGPFYAGWGLTRDFDSFPRRNRPLSLAALVYILLVEYGHYVDPVGARQCSPEVLIEHLAQRKGSRYAHLKASVLTGISWAARKVGL
ncbi:hypothetical protein G8764_10000 [Pseudomaricurvus alcaniphilus]|uniref:capsular polysaccharide export protein, LipB/KpsS family n=1 Tax=Pseudomaricurvus alcaniphilus TaxID=1166482 RepID=UPI00140D7F7A|nr:hypothetical protein [Pseudomaricurvus alcaniphilus]NHN37625.1 hypothetical protein [Pseudomaricurvus alcaniphilus]